MSIAELLLPAIRWAPATGFEHQREILERGLDLGVGGFIIFGGRADAVSELTEEMRARSSVPLLIGSDLERGAGQQFEGLTGLPPLAALGALRDERAIRDAATLSAREARSVGVNWIYTPVCDLDVEPENPIVGTRAFGGEPQRVGEQVFAWVRACQAEGVLACAKHFPGHGRTTGDSHKTLPVVHASRELMHAEDLVPFRAALNADVASVMTAHVSYPAFDPSGAPATVSAPILRGLLRTEMRFRGLIVTDALIMEGVKSAGAAGAASVRAIEAGCDLLLYPEDLEAVTSALEDAVDRGPLSVERIAESQDRRRWWAEWARDREAEPATDADRARAAEIAARSVFLVRGSDARITSPTEVVVIDDDVGGPYPPPSREPFFEALASRGATVHRVNDPGAGVRTPLIVALFGDIRGWKGRAGYSAETRDAVRRAIVMARAQGRPSIIAQFSHPRLASEVPDAETVLCAWGGERAMQDAMAARLVEGVGA